MVQKQVPPISLLPGLLPAIMQMGVRAAKAIEVHPADTQPIKQTHTLRRAQAAHIPLAARVSLES